MYNLVLKGGFYRLIIQNRCLRAFSACSRGACGVRRWGPSMYAEACRFLTKCALFVEAVKAADGRSVFGLLWVQHMQG